MAAHAVRPLAERHFAGLALAMQGEPVEDGLGLFARRLMVAGEIGEALVVAQHHAAMALAVPQAGLGGDGNAPRRARRSRPRMWAISVSPPVRPSGPVFSVAENLQVVHMTMSRMGLASVPGVAKGWPSM